MTANTMEGDREACLKGGMDDFISKPILPADLRKIIARWFPQAEADSTEAASLEAP